MFPKFLVALLILLLIVGCIFATVTMASIGTVATAGIAAQSINKSVDATATAGAGVAQVVIPYQTDRPPLRADIKKLSSMVMDGGVLELKTYHGVYDVQAGDPPSEGFDPKAWLVGDYAKLHVETKSIAKTDLTLAHVYATNDTIVVELVEPNVETVMDSSKSYTVKTVSGVLNQTPIGQIELVNAVVFNAQRDALNQGLIARAKDFAKTFFTPFFQGVDKRSVQVIWTGRPETKTCLYPGYSSSGKVNLADWLGAAPRFVSWRTAVELNPGIEQLYAQSPNTARQIIVPIGTKCEN